MSRTFLIRSHFLFVLLAMVPPLVDAGDIKSDSNECCSVSKSASSISIGTMIVNSVFFPEKHHHGQIHHGCLLQYNKVALSKDPDKRTVKADRYFGSHY